MNKTELVSAMAEHSGLTKKDAEAALKAFVETVEDTVCDGSKVELIGFGTFESRERSARKGRNPRTREEIEIEASTVPAFKAGKSFKDRVKKANK